MLANLLTKHKTVLLTFLLSIGCLLSFADDGFDQRAEDLINLSLTNDGGFSLLTSQAYMGQPLNDTVLEKELTKLPCKATADFSITWLVRILNFTNGEYDDQILSVLEELPFWLSDGEESRQYWSENHMLMWMSANWLLHEKYGWETRPTLRQNLVHWLNLKIEYGFYEYFSTVYLPFTSSGLLNLVDFAEDEEIKALATQAFTRLYKDILLVVNEDDAFYPTAGRNEFSRYRSFYGSSMQRLIYLLSGLGTEPNRLSTGSGALATSTLNVDDIVNSWETEVNTTLDYGHPLSRAREIHAALSREDRIVFQWSSGGYFHPLVAEGTLWQIGNYNLWAHEEFEPFSFTQFFPPSIGRPFAEIAASITRSSYIGSAEIDIFKNKGVVLTSSHDKWKGRLGYQIYPVAATIGTTCVFPRSGEVKGFERVPSRTSNEHLPYVSQDENVALIMYRHNWDLAIWGYDNYDVALFWQDEKYDEVRTFDNWLLGRIGESYVAVKKHCDDEVNKVIEVCRTITTGEGECGEEVHPDSIIQIEECENVAVSEQACDDADGQTWAIVVGNFDMHGSFDDFEEIIRDAVYVERWYFKWQTFEWVYFGRINVDGKNIQHAWAGSILQAPSNFGNRTSGDRLAEEVINVDVYPNPTQDVFIVNFKDYEKEVTSLSVFNNIGQVMFESTINASQDFISVETDQWANGAYTILIENSIGDVDVKRLVVKH